MGELFKVDENLWKTAIELFERNEETFNEDVKTIKEWLKTQPHLPEVMEDIKIKNFLLLNKCSVEKCKQKIDMYYTIRSLIPDMYDFCNPKLPNMVEFMERTYFFPHPKLVDGLYRVYFCKLKPSKKSLPKETILQLVNYSEIRLYEDCMVGDIWIVDLMDYGLNEMTILTPTLLKKMITMYQVVYSFRMKKMYYINSPSWVSKLLTLFKGLLKPKIFDRMEVYEDTQILHTIFANEDVPQEYGGNGPTMDNLQENAKLKLDQYQARFDLLDKLRVDETLRPEKLTNDEILGFHGNFKKLNVD